MPRLPGIRFSELKNSADVNVNIRRLADIDESSSFTRVGVASIRLLCMALLAVLVTVSLYLGGSLTKHFRYTAGNESNTVFSVLPLNDSAQQQEAVLKELRRSQVNSTYNNQNHHMLQLSLLQKDVLEVSCSAESLIPDYSRNFGSVKYDSKAKAPNEKEFDKSMSTFFNYSSTVLKRAMTADNWTQWAQEAHRRDPRRPQVLQRKLKAAAGIYKNRAKAQLLGLERTVMVTVVSLRKDDSIVHLEILQNWICFCRHYGFKPLIYVLHDAGGSREDDDDKSSSSGSKVNMRSGSGDPREGRIATTMLHTKAENVVRERLGVDPCTGDVHIISYPDQLFWELISQKREWVDPRKESIVVDFAGSEPSFKHFGAIVMLIPLLEVLEAGYGAIFFDVDVVFIKDPIPFMIVGSDDLVVSVESRACENFNSQPCKVLFDYQLANLEPNTGVTHVRAGGYGPVAFRIWMEHLVQKNTANDQKLFDYNKMGLKVSSDCHWNYKEGFQPVNIDYAALTTDRERQRLVGTTGTPQNSTTTMATKATVTTTDVSTGKTPPSVSSQQPSTTTTKQSGTFCFLPDFLFQNGMIGLKCGDRPSRMFKSAAEFTLTMDAVNNIPNYDTSPVLNSANWELMSIQGKLPSRYVSPITFHLNYVGSKITAAADRGLWLVKGKSDVANNPSKKGGSAAAGASSPALQCERHDIANTPYGSLSWMQQLDLARDQLAAKMAASYPPGTLVTFPVRCNDQIEVATIKTSPSKVLTPVYIVDAEYRLRKLPNWSTTEVLYSEFHNGKRDVKIHAMCDDRALNALKRADRDVPKFDTHTYLPGGGPQVLRSQKKLLTEVVSAIRSSSPTPRPLSVVPAEDEVSKERSSTARNNTRGILDKTSAKEYLAHISAAAEALDHNRKSTVSAALSRVAGIYAARPASRGRLKSSLSKTVLVTVVTSLGQLEMLHNWLCATQSFGLRSVVYVLPPILGTDLSNSNSTSSVKESASTGTGTATASSSILSESVRMYELLQRFRPEVEVLSYPVARFWDVMSLQKSSPLGKEQELGGLKVKPQKSKPKNDGNSRRSSGDDDLSMHPSPERFGSYLTLIPLLEVLDHGYSVLYLDTDVTIIKDPVPYLTAGTADFNVGQIVSQCSHFLSYINFTSIREALRDSNSNDHKGKDHKDSTAVTLHSSSSSRFLNDCTISRSTNNESSSSSSASLSLSTILDTTVLHIRASRKSRSGYAALEAMIQDLIVYADDYSARHNCVRSLDDYQSLVAKNGGFASLSEDSSCHSRPASFSSSGSAAADAAVKPRRPTQIRRRQLAATSPGSTGTFANISLSTSPTKRVSSIYHASPSPSRYKVSYCFFSALAVQRRNTVTRCLQSRNVQRGAPGPESWMRDVYVFAMTAGTLAGAAGEKVKGASSTGTVIAPVIVIEEKASSEIVSSLQQEGLWYGRPLSYLPSQLSSTSSVITATKADKSKPKPPVGRTATQITAAAANASDVLSTNHTLPAAVVVSSNKRVEIKQLIRRQLRQQSIEEDENVNYDYEVSNHPPPPLTLAVRPTPMRRQLSFSSLSSSSSSSFSSSSSSSSSTSSSAYLETICRKRDDMPQNAWEKYKWSEAFDASVSSFRKVRATKDRVTLKTKRSPQVYVVYNSTRKLIPDFATFLSLGLDSKSTLIFEDDLNLYYKLLPESGSIQPVPVQKTPPTTTPVTKT